MKNDWLYALAVLLTSACVLLAIACLGMIGCAFYITLFQGCTC